MCSLRGGSGPADRVRPETGHQASRGDCPAFAVDQVPGSRIPEPGEIAKRIAPAGTARGGSPGRDSEVRVEDLDVDNTNTVDNLHTWLKNQDVVKTHPKGLLEKVRPEYLYKFTSPITL